MDDSPGITQADLLRALEEALVSEQNPEGAMTVKELSAATDMHETKIREGLNQLKSVGRLEVVRVRREDLAGRQMKVPAYRLKAASAAT